MSATIKASIIAVAVISLIPHQLMSEPIAAVVDSTTQAQLKSDIDQVIATADGLTKRLSTYVALQKLANKGLLSEPELAKLADAKAGKALLLESYVALGKITALLYNLEQSEKENKNETRKQLLGLIGDFAEALVHVSVLVDLARVQESLRDSG